MLGDDFLQLLGLASEVFDLAAGRSAGGVAGKAPLAGLEELFRPAVVEALGNAFTAAELGDRVLAAKAIQDDADLLFGRVTLARRPADALDPSLRTTGRWSWISVSSSLLEGYDEPEILPSSSR